LKWFVDQARRFLCPHGLDQRADTDDVHDPGLRRHRRPPRFPGPGCPGPIFSKTIPVPANHGFRLHDGQGIQAAGPQTIEPDPKYPVEGCEPRPPVLLSLKDGQLVARGENLELELGTGSKPVSYDHGQKS
jgi:hypothetical protein